MTLIQNDVKKHVFARHHKSHTVSLKKPNDTGTSEAEQLQSQSETTAFAQDFTGDHKHSVSSDEPSYSLGAHASRDLSRIHLVQSLAQPDATSYSEIELAPLDVSESVPAQAATTFTPDSIPRASSENVQD